MERMDDLKTYMRDNGTYINCPPVGNQTSLITVFGDNRIHIQRTLRSIMQLVRTQSSKRICFLCFSLFRLADFIVPPFGCYPYIITFWCPRRLIHSRCLQFWKRSRWFLAQKSYSKAIVLRCTVWIPRFGPQRVWCSNWISSKYLISPPFLVFL